MYPNRHSSVPALPNVVVAAPTQHFTASQPSLGGQNYVQLPAGSPAFTMQPSAQPQMHHVSMTSQCYPATFMAARQHYGGGSFLFSHPSGSSNSPQHAGVPYLKKRTVFPKHVTNKLRQWLKDNIENPFPDEEQKDQLCKETKLTLIQLNYWFINARRRVWPSLRDEVNRERAKSNLPPVQLPLNRRGKESEQFDADESELMITDGEPEDMADELPEGCVMLQTATPTQLKNVRKGSMSSSSDLSSTMTSTEDVHVPEAVYAMTYTYPDPQSAQQSQSSESTSGDDQVLNGSSDNLPAERCDATIVHPRHRRNGQRQTSPPGQVFRKSDPGAALQAIRRQQLSANKLTGSSSMMHSAPCMYKATNNLRDIDPQASRHHYQSMPQIHPSFVPVAGSRQPSSIYIPPSNLVSQTPSQESLAAASPSASPQFVTMLPSPSSMASQVQHMHIGASPFVSSAVTPPQQQPPPPSQPQPHQHQHQQHHQQPIIFLVPSSSQHSS